MQRAFYYVIYYVTYLAQKKKWTQGNFKQKIEPRIAILPQFHNQLQT